MIDLGTGNNNKINWALTNTQELIDLIETVYRGARKGRGLVVSPKDYSTKRGRPRRWFFWWIFQGGGSRRRRGRHVDIPWSSRGHCSYPRARPNAPPLDARREASSRVDSGTDIEGPRGFSSAARDRRARAAARLWARLYGAAFSRGSRACGRLNWRRCM